MPKGPEDYLVWELSDVAQGKRPRSDYWRRDWGGDAYFSGATSSNWHPPELAIKYTLATGAELVRIREYLRSVFFPFQRRRFMGSELLTGIYGSMHLGAFVMIARAAASHGHPEIYSEALECTKLYMAILAARQCQDGRVLVCGMRSAGREFWVRGDVWGRWVLALGEEGGSDFAAWNALRDAGEGPKMAWQTPVFRACREILQEALSWVHSRGGNFPAGFTAMTELRILEWSSGALATWVGENTNANTRPEMLATYDPRVAESLRIVNYPGALFSPATDPKTGEVVRHNRGAWPARCELLNSRLVVTSDDGTASIALPSSGSWSRKWILPAESAAVPVPDPLPAPEDPEDAASFIGAVLALGAQDADAERLIALIRSGAWLEAASAVEGLAASRGVPRTKLRECRALAATLREESER